MSSPAFIVSGSSNMTSEVMIEIKRLSDDLLVLEHKYKNFQFKTATTSHLIKTDHIRSSIEIVVNKHLKEVSDKIIEKESDLGNYVYCIFKSLNSLIDKFPQEAMKEIKTKCDYLSTLEKEYKIYNFNKATSIHLIEDDNERSIMNTVANSHLQQLSDKIKSAERNIGMFVHYLLTTKNLIY
jgi:hypothetical protein